MRSSGGIPLDSYWVKYLDVEALQAENKALKDTLKQIQTLCIGVDLVTTAEDTIKLIYKTLPEGLIPEIEPPTQPKED